MKLPCQYLIKIWRYYMMFCNGINDDSFIHCAKMNYDLYVVPNRKYVTKACFRRTTEAIDNYIINIHNRKKAYMYIEKMLAYAIDSDYRYYGTTELNPIEVFNSRF